MKVKKAGLGSLINIADLFKTALGQVQSQRAPEQFYNLNLTSNNSQAPRSTAQATNPGTMSSNNIPVMDAKEVKTMSHGGSVEIGRGKDYIKDLL
jgi:hypothetical protein